MCKPRDAHLDVIELPPRRRSGNLSLLLVFGGSLLAVLGVGAWQTWENLPKQNVTDVFGLKYREPPLVVTSCAHVAKDFEAGALAPGRTVYHISGCHDQKEYWIIQIEPITKGETNGQGKNRVRAHAGRQG